MSVCSWLPDSQQYILVIMDYFTKWPEADALPNQESGVVAQAFVESFICQHGIPEELHTDQGRNFESELLKEVCRLLAICKTRTTPLRPQTDGMVERFNRTIIQQLALFTTDCQDDWEGQMPETRLALAVPGGRPGAN